MPHHPLLNCSDGFTLRAWIYPTTPQKGLQGLLTKLSGQSGYGLFIDEDGSLALWVGDGTRLEKVSTGVPLAHSAMALYRRQLRRGHGRSLPLPGTTVQLAGAPMPEQRSAKPSVLLAVGENQADLLMAAASGPVATHHFNGKIDNPCDSTTAHSL